jgi:hypothetical protein
VAHSIITNQLRDQVRAAHKRGLGRNAIAEEVGVARGTVTKVANELGLDFDRTGTAKATEARSIDAKVRRLDIIERLYTRTEFILSRLEADIFEALVPSGPGVQDVEQLGFVPAVEERQIAAAMNSYLAAAEKLERVDADNGVHAAESMLGKLVEGIGVPDE